MYKAAIMLAGLGLALASCSTTDSGGAITDGDGSASTATVNLTELNASGITGAATLTGSNGSTTVSVTLNDAGTGPQPIHIHPGTCDDLDPTPAYPLENVENGTSETTVEVALSDLQGGSFAINVHKSPEEAATYVACGNIA